MKRPVAPAFLLAALATVFAAPAASAASLPTIKASSSNAVPACATPGRLMAFLRERNPRVASRYDNIASDYMRHGEELGIRWDYGFFQMIVETNSLLYTGDVRARQNNFAGLGATGGGVRGESFASVSDGVRGHLEHILMYTGTYIANPMADRTRKVQEWRVLDKWRNTIRGPMTYTHLTRKWSPPDRGYARDIETIADIFYDRHCNTADPNPELLANVRGTTTNTRTQVAALQPNGRQNLGATSIANTLRPETSAAGGSVKVLNAANTPPPTAKPRDQATQNTRIATLSPGAMLGGTPKTKPQTKPKPTLDLAAQAPKTPTCKVWQASYGGSRAIIIKAVDKNTTNYTVLDVNAGREKREADAYISAYAKGGKTIAEFTSPKVALNKAFKLCPEK